MATMRRTIRDGLIVGLIAYASVAAFYAVFDLLAARGALYTVDLLGKSVKYSLLNKVQEISVEFQVGDLSPGVYLLSVEDKKSGDRRTEKIQVVQ